MDDPLDIKFREPKIVTDGGPWAIHDMACAVCFEKSAVLDLNAGIFLPCWRCQGEGFLLLKVPQRLRRFLRR